jgi:hypothetical protein
MSAVVDTDVYSLGVLLYELNADGTCCFGMAPRGSNPIQMWTQN